MTSILKQYKGSSDYVAFLPSEGPLRSFLDTVMQEMYAQRWVEPESIRLNGDYFNRFYKEMCVVLLVHDGERARERTDQIPTWCKDWFRWHTSMGSVDVCKTRCASQILFTSHTPGISPVVVTLWPESYAPVGGISFLTPDDLNALMSRYRKRKLDERENDAIPYRIR